MVITGQLQPFPHHREDFGLLHGIDAKVRFQLEFWIDFGDVISSLVGYNLKKQGKRIGRCAFGGG